MIIKGADIRRMRLNAGLTTREMAKIVGVKTRKTYENWERNTGCPNINQFIAICEGCQVSVTEFLIMAMKRENLTERIDLTFISKRKE